MLKYSCESNQPVIAIFLGKEDCPWSQKIQQEFLVSSALKERVEEEAIVWVAAGSLEQGLSTKYAIERWPCILLLDPHGKEFARLDYDASHPDLLVEKIWMLIEDFEEICRYINRGLQYCDESQLQSLYIKAGRLSIPCFKQFLLSQGLSQEKGTFFHAEKYASLVHKLKLKHPEVLKLKKKMLARDPQNHWHTHYKIALIEFEKKAQTLKKKDRIEKALAPLEQYLERFGSSDRENRWKLELQMAEFLFVKQLFSLAFDYAEKAIHHAPLESQAQVLKTLAYMKEMQP